MPALLAFLPDEILILIPIILGFLVMTRLISVGRAMLILCGFAVMMAMIPLFSNLLDLLPLWLLMLIIILCIYSLARCLSGAVLGKGVTDHLFGSILYDIFLIPFRMIRWIFQMIFRRNRI